MTPLTAAVEARELLLVKMLANSCQGLVDHQGKTALLLALEEAVRLLGIGLDDEQALRAFSFDLEACRFLSLFE